MAASGDPGPNKLDRVGELKSAADRVYKKRAAEVVEHDDGSIPQPRPFLEVPIMAYANLTKAGTGAAVRARLIRAVAYYRMSSDKQDKSIPAQRSEVQKYAKAHGYVIVREYLDEGISGAESTKRLDFNRLIADAQQEGNFEVILLWDQDRFSRFDPMEANYYWFLLRQAGVRIVTVCQGALDFADLGGWLSASVTQHGKAQYLRDLSRNILRGRLAKAQRGKWTHHTAPYGYQIVNNGDLIRATDGSAEIVAWLFEQYASMDVSLWDLAAELHKRAVPSPSGKPWRICTVRTILRRDTYATGKVMQFAEHKGKFYSVVDGEIAPAAKGKSRSVGMVVECPTLISEELWERAQASLTKRRKKTSPRREQTALLVGIMYCGHCGAKMYAAERPRGKRADIKDQLYTCSTYHARGSHGCQRNLIHEAPLLEFLIGKIRDWVSTPELFAKLKTEMKKQAGARTQRTADDEKGLNARAAKLDAEIAAAVKELKRTPDDLYELAVADLRELREQRRKVADAQKARKAASEASHDDVDALVEKGVAELERLRERISDANPKVARHALQEAIERIDLWFEHVKSAKITRSVFKRGIVKFKSSPVVGSDWPELTLLPGVGEVLAKSIVESRETRGEFRSHDDLRRVKGIGKKTLEKIKPYLVPIADPNVIAGN